MDAFMDIEPLFGPMSPVLDPEDMAPLSDSEDPPEMHPLMYDSVPRLLSPIPSPPRDTSPPPRDASPPPRDASPPPRDASPKKRLSSREKRLSLREKQLSSREKSSRSPIKTPPTSPIVPTSPLLGPMIPRPISPDPSPRRYNRLEPSQPLRSEPKRSPSPLRHRSQPSQPLRSQPYQPFRRPNNRIQYVPYKRMNERRRQVFYHNPVEILVLAAENNSYVLTNGQVSYCEDKNLSWRKHLLDDLKSFRGTKLYVLDPTSKKMYQDAQKTWREEEKWSSVKEIILCNTKRHLGKCSYCGEACLRFKAIVGGIMRIIPFELNMISH